MEKETKLFYDALPANVKESTVLSEESKKVLAALMNYSVNSEAMDTGIIYIGNERLRKLSGINKNSLLPAILGLVNCNIITREKGKPRVEGERSIASKYTINHEALEHPIKRLTFEEIIKLRSSKNIEKAH